VCTSIFLNVDQRQVSAYATAHHRLPSVKMLNCQPMTRDQTFFFVTILVTFACTVLLLYPFLKYLVLASLLTYLLHPLKRKLQQRIASRRVVALLIIALVLVAIILPVTYITLQLVQEVRNAVALITESPGRYTYLETVESWIQKTTGQSFDLHAYKTRVFSEVKSFLLHAAPDVLGSLTELILGMFIMCFVMYYALQEGRRGFEEDQAVLRLEKIHAPPGLVVGEGEPVEIGVLAAEGELEAAFAGGVAVAAAGVASGLGEDRHDLVGEIDR